MFEQSVKTDFRIEGVYKENIITIIRRIYTWMYLNILKIILQKK